MPSRRCLTAIAALALAAGPIGDAAAEPVWVSVDQGVLEAVQHRLGEDFESAWVEDGRAVVLVSRAEVDALGRAVHEDLHRCGGFAVHDSLDAAIAATRVRRVSRRAAAYTIDRPDLVEPALAELTESNVLATIVSLSAFENRYYTSASGIEAAEWIADEWRALAGNRTDVTVELIDHGSYPQRSVLLEITGSARPEEIVVVGGHLDSIAPGREDARAPGADDNASGIAVMTEVARALLALNYRPERTVRFYGFAAEEVGLRGSGDIADRSADAGENIVAMLQLDMSNVKGSDIDIAIMADDYTDMALNAFLGDLIDEYVGVPWIYDQCGYACTDHASFAFAGFPASHPFESRTSDFNYTIHTPDDTLDVAGGTASHAMNFAELTAAYVAEAAKGALGAPPDDGGDEPDDGGDDPEDPDDPGQDPAEPGSGDGASGVTSGCRTAGPGALWAPLLALALLSAVRRRRRRDNLVSQT